MACPFDDQQVYFHLRATIVRNASNDSSSRSNRVRSTARIVSDCSYNTPRLMNPDGSMLGAVVIASFRVMHLRGVRPAPQALDWRTACRRAYATTGPRLLLPNITGGLLRCGYLQTHACPTWQKELVPRDVGPRLPDLGCVGGSDVRHLAGRGAKTIRSWPGMDRA